MTGHRALLYGGHHFPSEIIAETVWHYFRFQLSFRMEKTSWIIAGSSSPKWHLDEGVPRGTHSNVGPALHERCGYGLSKPTVRGRFQTTASCDGK